MAELQWNYTDNKNGINALKSGKLFFYSDNKKNLKLMDEPLCKPMNGLI
jgi:hypothetical protein